MLVAAVAARFEKGQMQARRPIAEVLRRGSPRALWKREEVNVRQSLLGSGGVHDFKADVPCHCWSSSMAF